MPSGHRISCRKDISRLRFLPKFFNRLILRLPMVEMKAACVLKPFADLSIFIRDPADGVVTPMSISNAVQPVADSSFFWLSL